MEKKPQTIAHQLPFHRYCKTHHARTKAASNGIQTRRKAQRRLRQKAKKKVQEVPENDTLNTQKGLKALPRAPPCLRVAFESGIPTFSLGTLAPDPVKRQLK